MKKSEIHKDDSRILFKVKKTKRTVNKICGVIKWR